ncbi:MAG: 2-amino-4-hydroxy-6-hydroxymethyldihydropteridine diphosphokinase [Sedimentisphaerales bacterium]|nr:2-amino-4-hydroxy-6-hydroxymethyldihydropteridine diphosphokinase [Sedimentisphaerales bacterium]
MTRQRKAYISLGSNLGDRKDYIQKALNSIKNLSGTNLLNISEIYETKPLADADQPKYLNAVAQIDTELPPEILLGELQKIEDTLGRQRTGKWQSRNIDLDILLYGDEIVNIESLTIPHPQMHLRLFVLKGLCELNPVIEHPILKVTASGLACRLNGQDFTLNPNVPQLISIAGVIGVGKTTLAKKLNEQLKSELILEPYDTNPFLPQVYAGNKQLALPCQLFFLLHRTEQLNRKKYKPQQVIFSDYVFEKELLYAQMFLNSENLELYNSIYPDCLESIIKPSLVIYLNDKTQSCLERIHKRNRPYEQKIDIAFLNYLEGEYESMFKSWTQCPIIRISKSEFDCNNDKDLEYLINQIKAYIIS